MVTKIVKIVPEEFVARGMKEWRESMARASPDCPGEEYARLEIIRLRSVIRDLEICMGLKGQILKGF